MVSTTSSCEPLTAASSFAEQAYNVGRNATLLAGFDHHVPGCTVNRFCASSLQTLRMAFHAITVGEGDQYVAAGVESITQVNGYPKSEDEIHPALFGDDAPIANVYIPMGMTAENVAERWDVSREDMDSFAQRSQERAVAAQDSGFFDREVTPWDGVARDDGPRRGSTLEALATLEPAFKPGGKVTAGNSCPLNDGAAAVVVTDGSFDTERRRQLIGGVRRPAPSAARMESSRCRAVARARSRLATLAQAIRRTMPIVAAAKLPLPVISVPEFTQLSRWCSVSRIPPIGRAR